MNVFKNDMLLYYDNELNDLYSAFQFKKAIEYNQKDKEVISGI